MDLSNEKESGSMDLSSRECSSDLGTSGLKSCKDCGTTKTPLWRGGPSGPKSLCNACGIRYRKKRREVLGLKERRIGGEKEMRGGGFWKQRSAVFQKQRMLGEEEEAAVLLMALSSGFR